MYLLQYNACFAYRMLSKCKTKSLLKTKFSIHFVLLSSPLSKVSFSDNVRFQKYVRILFILNKVTPFLNIDHFDY